MVRILDIFSVCHSHSICMYMGKSFYSRVRVGFYRSSYLNFLVRGRPLIIWRRGVVEKSEIIFFLCRSLSIFFLRDILLKNFFSWRIHDSHSSPVGYFDFSQGFFSPEVQGAVLRHTPESFLLIITLHDRLSMKYTLSDWLRDLWGSMSDSWSQSVNILMLIALHCVQFTH